MFERERFKYFLQEARDELDRWDSILSLQLIGRSLKKQCDYLPRDRIKPPFDMSIPKITQSKKPAEFYLSLYAPPIDDHGSLPIIHKKCHDIAITNQERELIGACLDRWIAWTKSGDYDPVLDSIEATIRSQNSNVTGDSPAKPRTSPTIWEIAHALETLAEPDADDDIIQSRYNKIREYFPGTKSNGKISLKPKQRPSYTFAQKSVVQTLLENQEITENEVKDFISRLKVVMRSSAKVAQKSKEIILLRRRFFRLYPLLHRT